MTGIQTSKIQRSVKVGLFTRGLCTRSGRWCALCTRPTKKIQPWCLSIKRETMTSTVYMALKTLWDNASHLPFESHLSLTGGNWCTHTYIGHKHPQVGSMLGTTHITQYTSGMYCTRSASKRLPELLWFGCFQKKVVPPNHPILIGFSIIFTIPFWGTLILGGTPILSFWMPRNWIPVQSTGLFSLSQPLDAVRCDKSWVWCEKEIHRNMENLKKNTWFACEVKS